jgi:hypothetical protein
MSIKNRFFKTTQGVPFELVIADTLITAAGTSVTAFQTAGPLFKMGVFAESFSSVTPISLATNVVIPTTDRKKMVKLGYTVEQTTTGEFIIRSTTSLRADSIKAEFTPYKAPAFQDAKIVNAGVGTISVNQILTMRIIETTPMSQPMPSWDYTEQLTFGETAAFAKIIAKINANKEEEFFTATAVAGGIQIVSNDASRHFKIVSSILPTKADPSETGVFYAYTVTTQAYAGSGTKEHVMALQIEDNIRRGISHYYPIQNAVASEFGLPKEAVGVTTNFDIVVLSGYATEASPTPVEQHYNKKYIFVCVPAGLGDDIVAMFNF